MGEYNGSHISEIKYAAHLLVYDREGIHLLMRKLSKGFKNIKSIYIIPGMMKYMTTFGCHEI